MSAVFVPRQISQQQDVSFGTVANDDFLQRKSGAWSNRTVAQVKTDLGLTGTNSGDQTITLTGDVTGTGTGTFTVTIANNAVTFAKFVAAGSAGFVGATASGNYSHRTPTQVTAALDVMVGDSGGGGTKGLVPAPAAGDASKFLRGDGTYANGGSLSGTGSVDNAILRADGTGGATLQNSDFIIDDATVSTANNVTISNAHSGQANSSFVIAPKGTGAFILGPKPDGTTTGGNARGTSAVDLQVVRSTAATRIASGNYSFLGAGNNNSATGTYSAVAGSVSSQATGQGAFIGGGNAVTASGANSAIIASDTCTASGAKAAVISGDQATASAASAVAFGQFALANRQYQQTQAAGRFAAIGDAQASRLVVRRSTTDATQTEMTIDGAAASGTTITTSNRVIMNASSTMMVDVRVVARSTSGTDNACYHRRCIIKRDASNNTALVGSVQTVGTDIESNAAWDVTLAADDTNESLQILVTGAAATTIRWVAEVSLVEVSLT